MSLKEQAENVTDNDYIVMLSAYMCAAEDGDEIIEALYEFVSNCKGFVEPDEDMTQQVTKEEFEEVLSECEDKCAIMSCIEETHTINVAEVPIINMNIFMFRLVSLFHLLKRVEKLKQHFARLGLIKPLKS